MFERPSLQILKKRMNEPRGFIQVVFGPRQVGKTTMLAQVMKQLPFGSLMVSADDVAAAGREWIRSSWSEARRRWKASAEKDFLLVIDEIQKVSNWSETVKKEWDDDTLEERNIKVVILGSSRLLIQRGLTESLAGRFETIFMPHWTFAEMSDAFDCSVDHYIWFGGYPGSEKLTDDEDRWKAYIKDSLIETSISKDVLMLTRVDKPALLKRLFEIGCIYSSQILSLNKLQGELQEKGNLTTLSNYLVLLDGAGLLAGLEKYSGNMIRKRSSKPKFQVYNNALISAQSNVNFHETRSDPKRWGRLSESAVGAHMLNAAREKKFDLYYWNENNKKVDFVIEKNGILTGLEVKSGASSHNEGMQAFDHLYHPRHILTVGTGGIPIDQFLATDPGELLKY